MSEAAVLVVSSAPAARDAAGPLLRSLLEDAGLRVRGVDVVPDDRAVIEGALREQVHAGTSIVLTAGGSGLTYDDVTPDATRAVIERDAPGLAEALRARALQHTPLGALTRGTAGIAGRTLIVNLPGSPKAIEEVFGALGPVLEHAAALIASDGGSRHLHA